MPERRPRVGKRRKAAKVAGSALAAAALGSCWVSIAPPAGDLPLGVAGTGSLDTGGVFGASGGTGSTSSSGGSGASNMGGSGAIFTGTCGADEKACANGCVKVTDPSTGCADPDCAPCNSHGEASCNNMGVCVVESCALGWANCDGSARNGCEHQFGDSVVDTNPGSPLFVSEIASPPMASDWAKVPLIPMAKACAACTPNMPGGKSEPTVQNVCELPPSIDASAYFRLGYSDSGLYLEALVFDDQLQASSTTPLMTSLDQQDSILVLLDGKHDGGAYGADDHYLQLGLNGAVGEQERASNPDGVTVGIESLGPACYRMQAKLTWKYISGLANTPNVRPLLPATLGFDVMANDVDKNPATMKLERQSLLFWQLPGTTFAYNTDAFPAITLQ